MKRLFLAATLLAALAAQNETRAAFFVSTDFNANDGGFTSAVVAPFNGPWVYNPTGGVGGTGGWSTSGQVPENGQPNTTTLTSPAVIVTSSGAVTLSFDHHHSFEDGGANWDGGKVLLSVNAGAFTAVPLASFSQNGYNGTVVSNSVSVLAGQEAFVSTSANYQTQFLTSIANLGSFNVGDSLRVQFIAGYDSNTSGAFDPDWAIDNVSVSVADSSVVPEPSSLTLVAIGLATFAACRRRRRAKSS